MYNGSSPLPVSNLNGFSLTNNDEVLILSGGFTYPDCHFLDNVYEGVLNENWHGELNVKWKRLGDMKKARAYHVSFYLKNKLHFVAGSCVGKKWLDCCEVYDLLTRTWSD